MNLKISEFKTNIWNRRKIKISLLHLIQFGDKLRYNIHIPPDIDSLDMLLRSRACI